ncbi:hypothetical protein L202_02284 [Cryptococcus amylolentus CBS 6039]|uniref:Pentatricopeptide repeat-containing protein-mitochondrial domain-containing protein n=1 Tax=Cryptococcus amylolentus CBS 6039 TaxID=1295533 RepID=A0A1E3I1S6_9TREE|nr:hypothetical protein L202_02284 [Cryptococcus amylolentus CBS 6039]ODN81946.1 hypothetical protein L202_02284 [Cryptococcus amylolentus CBS 6039]
MLRLPLPPRAAARVPAAARAYATAPSQDLPPKRPRVQPPRTRSSTNGKPRLPWVLKTLTEYKAENRVPSPLAYINIIEAASEFASSHSVDGGPSEGIGFQVAMAAWEDARRGGIELGQKGLDAMMGFAAIYPHLLPSLLLYNQDRHTPTYNAIARVAQTNYELEEIVRVVDEMFKQGLSPNSATIRHTVRLACEWGHPRLALQIAEKAENESTFGFRLDPQSWVHILIASADNHYLHGIETAWERVRTSYTPDEGLIISILNTAGRWGRPDISSDFLSLLSGPPQEHHLAPLLEAFCNAGEVPNAFQVLSNIRDAGLAPSLATAQPIVAVLQNTEVIDQAFYTLEDMHSAGQAVDVVALNAIIEASVKVGDLQRARATQMAAGDLGVSCNIDSFNLVLQGCVDSKLRTLGDTLLSEMAVDGITPNATTFELVIELCATQPSYEDAFYYLEKMKGEGFKPSSSIYEVLVRKCVKMNDRRWSMVVEEMRAVGHKVDTSLLAFINSGGRVDRKMDPTRERRAKDQFTGSKRRSWQTSSADKSKEQ